MTDVFLLSPDSTVRH